MYDVFSVEKWSKGAILECLDTVETLAAAVANLRYHWMESPTGPQAFVVMKEAAVVATITRLANDPELCLVTFASGRVELWRCWYVLNAETQEYQSSQERLVSAWKASDVSPV